MVNLNFLSFRLEKNLVFESISVNGSVMVASKKKHVQAEVEYHTIVSRIKTVHTWNCIGAYSDCPYIGYLLRNYVTDTTQQNPSCEANSSLGSQEIPYIL